MANFLRSALALIAVLVFQVELFADLRWWGVMPELLLGVTISAAWHAGPERGAVVGFAAGLLYDVYLPTPLALNALTYVIVAFGVGALSSALAASGARLLRRMTSIIAIAAGVTLFVTLGELLGEPNLYTDRFLTVLVIATVYTSILMGPIHVVTGWAFGVDRRDAPTPITLSMVE